LPIAPNGSVGRGTRGVFIDEDRVAEYNVSEGRVGLDAGMMLGTWGEVRLGPLWRRVDATVDTGSPVLPSLRETSAGLWAVLFADQHDHPFFPASGHRAAVSAYVADRALGSDRNYKRLEGDFSMATAWSDSDCPVTKK
jgi:NTE family protein